MSALFRPLKLRGLTLPNRIAVAPMCQYSATDGLAGDWHLVHLGSRAVGGAGLVIVEATAVTPEGRITPNDLGLWNDAQADALGRIVRFVEAQGAVAGVQLAHAGRRGGRTRPWEGNHRLPGDQAWPLVAPSALPFSEAFPTPAELSTKQIDGLVEAFVSATRRARRAGFRVLELHMAHGYLLHSFLSPLSNVRTDTWGGSLAGRAALPLRLVNAVREVWPAELPLFVRLSVTDWADGGLTVEDSVQIASWMKQLGADMIDCSSGSLVPFENPPPTLRLQHTFAARIRREASIATGAVGGIVEVDEAAALIEAGDADLVLLGRALLDDPYWPLRAAEALLAGSRWPSPYARAVRHFYPTYPAAAGPDTMAYNLIPQFEIAQLKARYCRYLDAKRWDLLPSLFHPEARFEGFVAAPPGADVPTFIAGLAKRMKDSITFHQVFMPDIAMRGSDRARVIWSMTDFVEWPSPMGLFGDLEAVGFRGYGYYEEEYRSTADGWRISFMRLTRHRLDPVHRDGRLGPFGGVPLSPELMRPDPGWLID